MGFLINPYIHASTGIDYIVDEYGAEMAFSLRLVNSAYGGSAIRVRRTSDSTEQDIGFSGDDLDTSSLETFCSGTDGVITTWYDQSGNGNNATQTVAARQPTICTSGTTTADPDNGLPAMSLSGTLVFFSAIAGSSTTVQVFSYYQVFNREASGDYFFGIGNLSTSPHFLEWQTDDDLVSRLSGQTVHFTADSSTGDFVYTCLRDSGDTAKAWLNNSAGATSTKTTTGQTLNYIFTNGNYANGYCQEAILIHADVEADRGDITTNINDYYSIY